ncbi:MAG: hypothetical protein ILO42_08890 [Clostridia bacterium]|nr:hypothetical protein [Clostridia bacterium]
MKNTGITRLITVLAAVALLLCSVAGLSACADKPAPAPGPGTTAAVVDPANSSDGAPEATTAPDIDPHVAALDWKGGDFIVLYNGNDVEPNLDFIGEEINGSTLNDAVYTRNVSVQEKHKLVIKPVFKSDANIEDAVTKSIKGGELVAHLVEANQTYSTTMAIKGNLYTLDELTGINMSKPYWSDSFLAGSSLRGKNYFAYSDANVHAFGATPCTIFNKKVHNDFNLESIYALVDDLQWTFAKMSEMVKAVTGDLDGDQVITKDDRLGMIANTFCIDCFISGSGYPMIVKDDNDLPKLNILDEKFFTIIESIQSLCSAENGMFLVDRTSTATEAREYWTEQAITSDRALFWIGNFKCVERLRSSPSDFGVVPIPMANADQGEYKIHMQANIGASMSVPRSTSNFEEVSLILEDIAYQSSLDVMPAYMEVLIQGRSIRDVESLRCIQIIRNSYYCDMGFMLGNYGIGILGNCRAIVKDNTDIVSTLTKSASGFDRSLKNLAKQVN